MIESQASPNSVWGSQPQDTAERMDQAKALELRGAAEVLVSGTPAGFQGMEGPRREQACLGRVSSRFWAG